MRNTVVVHKKRTNVITVSLGIDVSGDTITSEIRTLPKSAGLLICTWTVTFATDGNDGELVLTLDNSIVNAVTHKRGYMDMKRIVGGEPVAVFDEPLEVIFQETVTV